MSTALSTRRLVAVTAALFLVILAFLAGRVHAGADPTQATPASNVTQSDPAPTGTDGYGTDPYGAPGAAPPGYAPDQGGSAVPDQGGGTVPDADPPATYAS